MRNRFKGLDLIERLMNYGQRFMTLYRRQGARPSPRKINAKKAKWLSEETLEIAVKRREMKSKGVKERYTHLNAELFYLHQYKISFGEFYSTMWFSGKESSWNAGDPGWERSPGRKWQLTPLFLSSLNRVTKELDTT